MMEPYRSSRRGGGGRRSLTEGYFPQAVSPVENTPPPLRGPPPPPGEELGKLAGLAGVLFGWTPEVFWGATPAELAALVRAAAGEDAAPLGADEFARLKEAFPDG